MKKKLKQDSFVSSERKVFNGLKLYPWTCDRSIAANALGMVYPNLSPQDWSSVKRGKIYPGAVRDVALALWLCSLSPDQVLDAELGGEREAKRLSGEWAGKQEIHDPSKPKFWDALSFCMGMWNEVDQSITVPEKSEQVEETEESGNE